jgi:hypothetical protein
MLVCLSALLVSSCRNPGRPDPRWTRASTVDADGWMPPGAAQTPPWLQRTAPEWRSLPNRRHWRLPELPQGLGSEWEQDQSVGRMA